jgi:hypothetical protein
MPATKEEHDDACSIVCTIARFLFVTCPKCNHWTRPPAEWLGISALACGIPLALGTACCWTRFLALF